MKNNKKNNLESILYLIAVMIILFISFSPILKGTKIGVVLNLLLLPLAIFNIIVFKKKVIFLKNKIILFVLILFILILKDCYNILFLYRSDNNVLLMIRLITLFIYFITINKMKFYNILEKSILVLSFIGLIMHIINIFNRLIFLKRLILNERLYLSFYGLYGYFDGRAHQNSGFTWEPSAWSILLGSLLLFRLIKNLEINFWNIILLTNMLTSQSTTGYILVLLIIVYYILIKISLKKIVFMTLILLFVLSSREFRDKVYYKIMHRNNYLSLKNKNFGVGSSAARSLHQKIDLEIFKNNIILGESNNNNNEVRKQYTQKLSSKNKIARYFLIKKTEYQISSNSFSYTLAKHGIIIFLLYFYLYFKNCFQNINKEKVLYLIIMIFIFNVQEVNWLPYFIMLIFMQNFLLKKQIKH